MRLRCLPVLALVGAATTVAAQTKTAPPKTSTKVLTLSGCVQRGDSGEPQYMLTDRNGGAIYRLIGTDVRDYVGRRVQVVGGVAGSTRLKISGGLKPTPNVAAQAGAIDPSQAAIAGATGPTSTTPMAEFRIKSIRPAEGGCP
jgi:hypothetical protein